MKGFFFQQFLVSRRWFGSLLKFTTNFLERPTRLFNGNWGRQFILAIYRVFCLFSLSWLVFVPLVLRKIRALNRSVINQQLSHLQHLIKINFSAKKKTVISRIVIQIMYKEKVALLSRHVRQRNKWQGPIQKGYVGDAFPLTSHSQQYF